MQSEFRAGPSVPMLVFLAVFVGLGLFAFAAFGFMGIGRGAGDYAFDLRYFFTAGQVWEDYLSPYDRAAFGDAMAAIDYPSAGAYAYPPTSAYFGLALSSGSLQAAGRIMGLLNILSVICMLAFVLAAADRSPRLWGGAPDRRLNIIYLALTAGVIIGNPFSAHVAWMGQTTLLAGAFLLVAWHQAERGRDIIAGIFLALGAMKPQLAFLVVLWFLMDRRWQLLIVSAVATLLISAWPIYVSGIEGSWIGWLTGLSNYQGEGPNQISFKHMFGLRSAFATYGVMLPTLLPVAIIAAGWLYWRSERYDRIWIIGVLFILSFLLIFSHDYDASVATIMTYPLLVATRGRIGWRLVLCAMGFVLFFPSRIWEHFGMADLARSRELALLVMLGMYLWLGQRVPGLRTA